MGTWYLYLRVLRLGRVRYAVSILVNTHEAVSSAWGAMISATSLKAKAKLKP